MARPCHARVFPAHLQHNAAQVKTLAPASKIMACVKADGYGHGIRGVAEALQGHVDGFAVACLEEALAVRDHGITDPILLLEGPQSADEIPIAAMKKLTLCVSAPHQLLWIEQAAALGPLDCWLKVDTGMHRLGFDPADVVKACARLRHYSGGRAPQVLCTHFANADQPRNLANTEQEARFDAAVDGIEAAHSLANSAAILSRPSSHRAWVRPGYMLYGGSPFPQMKPSALELKAAMEVTAQVIAVRDIPAGEAVGYGGRWAARRDSRIATIAMGYGDGYPRHAPDGTPVLIEGRLLPLVGNVSMDMITVDVTDHPAVQVGSRAELWGRNLGVDEVARHAGTIGYEILSAMPRRIPRVKEIL